MTTENDPADTRPGSGTSRWIVFNVFEGIIQRGAACALLRMPYALGYGTLRRAGGICGIGRIRNSTPLFACAASSQP